MRRERSKPRLFPCPWVRKGGKIHEVRSTGWQVVQGTTNAFSFGVCQAAQVQISVELWCVMLEDEVGEEETRTFPLPMGIERKDKHRRRGVHTGKGSKAPQMRLILGSARLPERTKFGGTMVRYAGRWGGRR